MKKAMNRSFLISVIVFAGFASGWVLSSFAGDPPHSSSAPYYVSCNKCHTLHNAKGVSLTTEAENYNLCISCHKSGGTASAKPFTDSMLAVSNASGLYQGISHSWKAVMNPTVDEPERYGLRAVSSITDPAIKSMLKTFNNKVTCSVCHGQHSQSKTPWDPYATTQKHFQRINNSYNALCVACHYYRAMTYTRAKGGDSGYPANGTNIFSHPVGEIINSAGYDYAAPLDVNGVSQTGSPRYSGDSDGNKTNNLILDPTSKVRCLSCHRIHYVDSNSLTNDAP
jgi:predicted CXXCH cytochrome family protein